jgi:UDP-N-acetylglucosamine acyltransferase
LKMSQIHPTAIIEKGAELGTGVTVGPYAIIGPNVVIHDHAVIKGHVYLDGNTTIGEGTTIWPGAVIGTKTQDLKYKGEKTYVTIGKNTEIRECATINSSCGEGSVVKVGDNCLIMAYCHVAHNCEVGNRVIMSNNATLAGHVIVEDCAIISGLTAVHQFSRIGKHAMVGGMSRITHDVPPFTIGAGSPYRLGGLNLVGLKRHGFSLESRKLLGTAFKMLFRSQYSLQEALDAIEQQLPMTPELFHLVNFCRTSKRGLIGFNSIEENQEPVEESEEATLKS